MPPIGNNRKPEKRLDRPDNKRPDRSENGAKKEGGGGAPSSTSLFGSLAAIIGGVIFINALLMKAGEFLSGGALNSGLVQKFLSFYNSFKVFSFLLSVALAFVVAHLVRNINKIRAEERKELYPEKEQETAEEVANYKWQRVVDHLDSENMSDWKLSILEADNILDEMLSKMGYHGDTIGDKLKQVEKSDFTTIDKAWEAHKTRNLIAHEGSDYVLTKKEAVRIIELYKDVFEEFFFI
jgi:hypothetical protein